MTAPAQVQASRGLCLPLTATRVLASRSRLVRVAAPHQAMAMSNDKGPVDASTLVPAAERSADTGVVNDLLESLTRMTLRGYRPTGFLLVRLTDGRVKLVHTPEGAASATSMVRWSWRLASR